MTDDRIIAKRFVIHNILGIENLEIRPGKVTVVYGENGAGKSTIIESLKSILKGGAHDATLLRTDTEAGDIELDLSDGMELQKLITREGSDFRVSHPIAGNVSRGVAYLKQLVDSLANPVEFLTAKPDKRVEYLLQAVPMQVTREDLSFIPENYISGISFDVHALSLINAVYKAIFSDRSDYNRSIKEKDGAIATLRKAAPPEAPEGRSWKMEKAILEAAVKKLNSETKAKLDASKKKFESQIKALGDDADEGIKKIEANLQASIKALEAGAEKAKEEIRSAKEKAVSVSLEAGDKEKETIESDYRTEYDPLKEKLTTAENRLEDEIRYDEARQSVQKFEADRSAAAAKSDELSDCLKKLDSLKAGLLEKLPVAGLEVKDGDIFVDRIPFDRVNEANRIKLSIEVAKLRAGKLGLIFVDGLEKLSPKNFELFKEEAKKSGLQFIISRVSSDDQLTIETDGKVEKLVQIGQQNISGTVELENPPEVNG